jgi:hypothetical protein
MSYPISPTDHADALEEAKTEAVNFVFDRLAKALGLEQWTVHDGSETWDGDVAATLYGILRDSRAIDPETDIPAKEHWQAWARKRLDIQSQHWLRAAKAALSGDMRELRNRVELAEAAPVEVVLS